MKLMICGFGRVGRAFAQLLLEKRPLLQDKYGLDAPVGAVVDLLGASVEIESQPLLLEELLRFVSGGGQVHQFPLFGREGLTGELKALADQKGVSLKSALPLPPPCPPWTWKNSASPGGDPEHRGHP